MSEVETFWNFEPTKAERGTAIVLDDLTFPQYWAKKAGIIGQRIEVVKVTYDHVFYLDNRDDAGWRKVTHGLGSPRYGHRNVSCRDFQPAA